MGSRRGHVVVVDGIEWLGVLRPDTGFVHFQQAVNTLRRKRVGFDPHDLQPAFFQAQDNDTFRVCGPADPGAFVGWLLP